MGGFTGGLCAHAAYLHSEFEPFVRARLGAGSTVGQDDMRRESSALPVTSSKGFWCSTTHARMKTIKYCGGPDEEAEGRKGELHVSRLEEEAAFRMRPKSGGSLVLCTVRRIVVVVLCVDVSWDGMGWDAEVNLRTAASVGVDASNFECLRKADLE